MDSKCKFIFLDIISSDMLANPPSLILLPSGLKMAEKGPWPEKVGNILSKDLVPQQ